MAYKKAEWPEVGDLIVATITKIAPYGAYATLDEYGGKEGLLHISELSTTWVKNIRNHVREGQKVVLKVLRVDPTKSHVDLSLRRVTGKEKKEKLLEWKKAKKAKVILKMTSEKRGVNLNEAYEIIEEKIISCFGSLYNGLEEASFRGKEVLIEAGIPEDWAKVLAEIAKDKIKVPRVKVRGILELTCTKSDGVEVIKRAFSKAKRIKKSKTSSINIYVVGTPRYRIEVSARDYKIAEEMLNDAVETALKSIEDEGGRGVFRREH